MGLHIEDENKRMKELTDNEGWESSDDRVEFDEFFPDYEKDIGKEIRGLFLTKIQLKKKKDGTYFDAYIIKTNEKRDGKYKVVALRDYHIIKKELDQAKLGDGIRVKYEGQKDKKKGKGFYHSFIVERKLFEPDQTPDAETPKLSDADDPEAINTIELYKELLKDKNNENPTAKEILECAKNDPDMNMANKTRIKLQLAEMVKRGDIKE